MWCAVVQADAHSMATCGRSWHREEGQTMAEYALVLAIITPVAVLAFITLGNAIIPALSTIAGYL
jgi:Flp pilus assembly pilin Flp